MNYEALCFGLMFVVGFLFLLAWIGMSGGPRYIARRPPKHPPGYKNPSERKA